MAKVVIFRESGNAVNVVESKKMEEEYKKEFDKLHEKFGLDMLKFHDALNELDLKLQEKYKCITEIEIPNNRKKFFDFLSEYGKIEMGIHPENKKVYIKILDIGI